ncbi:hypothetical protein MP638_005727 [Amoeboaphelidium occidentale]|nr:hypothetical protein MP638_005727 [Amoeboaphelidium occidentale]
MDNLLITKHAIYESFLKNAKVAVDTLADTKFACVLNDNALHVSASKPGQNPIDYCFELPEHEGDTEELLVLKYFAEVDAIVAVTSWRIFTAKIGSQTATVIADLSSRLVAAEFSPDEELLALVSSERTFLLLVLASGDDDMECDLLKEVYLDDLEHGHGLVSVGWGTEETQFKGAGMKAIERSQAVSAAVSSLEEKELVDEDESFAMIKAGICWRQDSDYCCVSYCDKQNACKRFLRVFDKNGELISTSEPDVVEDPSEVAIIAWRSINLVSVISKKDVAFYEKNGLRHGGFLLKKGHTTEKVVNMAWNYDSSILALCMERNGVIECELWTNANYHFYRKLILPMPSVCNVRFEGNSIYCSEFSGKLHEYLLSKEVFNCSRGEENQAVIKVIDGEEILVTDFAKFVMPPPMCQTKVKCSAQALHVNGDLALLSGGTVCSLSRGFEDFQTSEKARQVAPVCANIVAVLSKDDMGTDIISIYDTTGKILRQMEIVKGVSRMLQNSSKLYCYTLSNELVQVDFESGRTGTVLSFTQKMSKFIDILYYQDELFCFRILADNSLVVNDDLTISNACTSFLLTDSRLVYTTSNHDVNFVLFSSLQSVRDDPSLFTKFVYKRAVERGSVIVTAATKKMKMIFQLPRGNLECVAPRPFVIDFIVESILEKKAYKAAFTAARKHRIDLNLVVDLNPSDFIENLSELLHSISVDDANLLVSSLRDVNVIEEKFKALFAGSSLLNNASFDFTSKVNFVCEAIRNALSNEYYQDAEKKEQFLTILTTYLCQSPPKTEEMMSYLSATVKRTKKSGILDEGLKYVRSFMNLESLFEISLGLYDFELAVSVAQHANMDPREYAPIVESFNAEPNVFYQKYLVDNHLRRFDKAFENLVCGAFYKQAVKYMDEKKLYKNGLVQFSKLEFGDVEEYFNETARLFAEYLETEGKLSDAAGAYLLSNDSSLAEKAFELYVSVGEYEKAQLVSLKYPALKQNVEWYIENMQKLSDILAANRQFKEAAIVRLELVNTFKCGDIDEAISLFIEGKLFCEAVKAACENGVLQMYESELKDELKNAFESTLILIEDYSNTFTAKCKRLATIRQEKPNILVNEDAGLNDKMVDMISNASHYTGMTGATGATGATGSSRYSQTSTRTFKSARSKRKFERKKYDAREGGFYEEQGLVNELKSFITKFGALKDLVVSLTEAVPFLNTFKIIQLASKVQESYEDLVALAVSKRSEIFEPKNPSLNELPVERRFQISDCLQNPDAPQSEAISYLLQVYIPLEKPEFFAFKSKSGTSTLWKSELFH